MNRQLREVFAMAMIGEGVIGLLDPRRHLLLWRFGPRIYRQIIDSLTKHPFAMRFVFAAEAGLGLWWATSQLSAAAPDGEQGYVEVTPVRPQKTVGLRSVGTE
jgi:hypothetical protein